MTNIICRATLYKVLVNFNYHDYFFFFLLIFQNDDFQGGCFQAENFIRYSLKRSIAYLRLMPKNVSKKEGKRNVTVAPVKLFWAQNNQHSNIAAMNFARTRINAPEEIGGLLGTKQVKFDSQGDKAKIVLRLRDANKQVPILMQYGCSNAQFDTISNWCHEN